MLANAARIQSECAELIHNAVFWHTAVLGVASFTCHNPSRPESRLLRVQIMGTYSGHSFRLMALAMGVIPCVATTDLMHAPQAHIEASARPLRLLGLIVLSNPVKPDSKEVISELQDQ